MDSRGEGREVRMELAVVLERGRAKNFRNKCSMAGKNNQKQYKDSHQIIRKNKQQKKLKKTMIKKDDYMKK